MSMKTETDYRTDAELARALLERIDEALGAIEGLTTGQRVYNLTGIHMNEARAHLKRAQFSIREKEKRLA